MRGAVFLGNSFGRVFLPGSGQSDSFLGNGGPFSLMQLKVIQEVITLIIFTVFTTVLFKGETLHWNHFAAFVCLVLAVYFVFYNDGLIAFAHYFIYFSIPFVKNV